MNLYGIRQKEAIVAKPEQLFHVQARQNEIWRRLKAGSISVEDVLAGTQGILDGIYPTASVPEWVVSPEEQIKKVTAFLSIFGGEYSESIPIPTLPWGIGRIPLLTVFLPDDGKSTGLERTARAWWQYACASIPDSRRIQLNLQFDAGHLQMLPEYEYRPGIRWVAFEPNAYKGMSADAARASAKADGHQLAGLEILMAVALFPAWYQRGRGDNQAIPGLSALSALRCYGITHGFSRVPYLSRGTGSLTMGTVEHNAAVTESWCSPVVREC